MLANEGAPYRVACEISALVRGKDTPRDIDPRSEHDHTVERLEREEACPDASLGDDQALLGANHVLEGGAVVKAVDLDPAAGKTMF